MAQVKVTNRSNGIVVYRIPEKNIRREFNPRETKIIDDSELVEVSAQPGGRELVYNYLLTDEAVLINALNVIPEPEYFLTEEMIAGAWMDTCTLDEFKDAVEFAPEGVKDLIKQYAVSKPLNDMNKRLVIKEYLHYDVTKVLEMIAAEAAEAGTPAPTTAAKRRSNPNYKTANTETTTPPVVSKYNVTSRG